MTKEEILQNNELGDLYSIASALGWDFDDFKKCLHGAMDGYAKQEAVEFGKFISNHRLDFQPATNGCWIGLDMKTVTSKDLYELYLKSKEQIKD